MWSYLSGQSGGAPLDAFWLEGPVAISAREQVSFLERLRRGALPVSPRAMAEVRGLDLAELCRALDANAEVAMGGTWPTYAAGA